MKRLTLLLVAVVVFASLQLRADDPPPKRGGDGILQKGNIIVDAYYGFPNLWTTILRAGYLDGNQISSSSGSFGPCGANVEYMISKKIGVGLEVNYSTSWVQWTEADAIYDPNTGNDDINGNYKVQIPRLGIMPRFYYHFINHKHYDMYCSAGLGYRSTTFNFTTNDPNWDEPKITIIPVGYRIAVGGRYFFMSNLGLNWEFGIGGALVLAGLSVRI
jgi:hypothetical protein